jgi:Zn-dependent peptidase ImmA (M78 family)
VVNNSTAHAKQSFTLFHELCHLLFAVGGITKDDDRFVVSMAGVDREIEVDDLLARFESGAVDIRCRSNARIQPG